MDKPSFKIFGPDGILCADSIISRKERVEIKRRWERHGGPSLALARGWTTEQAKAWQAQQAQPNSQAAKSKEVVNVLEDLLLQRIERLQKEAKMQSERQGEKVQLSLAERLERLRSGRGR